MSIDHLEIVKRIDSETLLPIYKVRYYVDRNISGISTDWIAESETVLGALIYAYLFITNRDATMANINEKYDEWIATNDYMRAYDFLNDHRLEIIKRSTGRGIIHNIIEFPNGDLRFNDSILNDLRDQDDLIKRIESEEISNNLEIRKRNRNLDNLREISEGRRPDNLDNLREISEGRRPDNYDLYLGSTRLGTTKTIFDAIKMAYVFTTEMPSGMPSGMPSDRSSDLSDIYQQWNNENIYNNLAHFLDYNYLKIVRGPDDVFYIDFPHDQGSIQFGADIIRDLRLLEKF